MDDVKFFIPFEKKDDDERIVAGYATTEALDSQGEVVKISAIEKALPDYMKFGNIREMHQYSAVGKAIQANVDDAKRGLYLVVKVIDDVAWKKVKAGVYNGFSIGGRIVTKVNNAIEDLVLSEISLVDRPANPEAIFSLVKVDDGKVVKYMGEEVEANEVEEVEEGPAHLNVIMVENLSRMAADVAYMIYSKKSQDLEYAHLENMLTAIKDAMIKEIQLDKLAKSQEEDATNAEVEAKIEEIKTLLKEAEMARIQERNWSEKYFSQMQERV